MFKKILVALNKSDISLQALEEAIALAKATHAQLKLVHVLDNQDPDQPAFPYYTEYQAYSAFNTESIEQYHKDYQSFVNRSWQWLGGHANRVIKEGIPTEYDQARGTAGQCICDAANMWDADLIMIGSRGLSGLKELFWGSVSNYVIHHADSSVCVIHPHRHQTPQVELPAEQVLTEQAPLAQPTAYG